jgi:hypothetical protein
MLKKIRDFGYRLAEIFESLLIIPILLFVLVISITVSLPRLGPTVIELITLAQAGRLAAFDISKFNILLLPVLSFLAITLLKHVNKTEKSIRDVQVNFDASTRTLINSVRGVEFITFRNESELKNYLNKITEGAKREVADLTWAHRRSDVLAAGPKRTVEEQVEWTKLEAQHAKIVSTVAQTRRYREIFVLSRQDRIEKLKRRMRDNAPRYTCRILKDAAVPRLQFVVVDEAEVVFVSDNHKVLCSIKHPQLVRLMLDHFEDAWSMGMELVSFADDRAVWNVDLANRTAAEAEQKLKTMAAPPVGKTDQLPEPWVRPSNNAGP